MATTNEPISEFHQLVRNFGTTAQRPTLDLITGQTYFDTTLGSWIYWSGSAWTTVSGGSGGVTTATLPLAITGTNIALSATTAHDGGAVVLNPATQQAGALSISGTAAVGSVQTVSSVVVGTQVYLGSIPILDRGSTFPTSALVDGQRYFHTTYRAWFVYNLTDTKWRQEAPGVFSGSFPTVASGDNTVAPDIEAKRLDLNNRIYFWDGSVWNPIAGTVIALNQICRVLDDTTSRASPFTNAALQVTGVLDKNAAAFTMPTNVKAVWYSVILLTGATPGVSVSMVIENPDHTAGAVTLQGVTQNNGAIVAYAATGFMSLSSLGRLSYTYRGSANVSRTIVDITGYMT